MVNICVCCWVAVKPPAYGFYNETFANQERDKNNEFHLPFFFARLAFAAPEGFLDFFIGSGQWSNIDGLYAPPTDAMTAIVIICLFIFSWPF